MADVRILGFELKKDMAAKNVSHEANVRRPAVLAGQLNTSPTFGGELEQCLARNTDLETLFVSVA